MAAMSNPPKEADFPEPPPNYLDDAGIVVTGLVSQVGSYIKKGTDDRRFNLELMIPGSPIMKVSLSGDPGTRFRQGQKVSLHIVAREYKGNIFFTEAV